MSTNNGFINGKAVQLYIGRMIQSMPYLRASKPHFNDQIAGKKNGQDGTSYNMILRDAGTVGDGLSLTDSDRRNVVEIEVPMKLTIKHNVMALSTLESVVDLKDFKTEIADTYAPKLGFHVQKQVIDDTYFDACVAAVSDTNGWMPLSKIGATMKQVRQAAQLIGSMDPQVETNLSINALNNWKFGSTDKFKDFYEDAYIGRFNGVEYAYCTDIPQVDGKTISGTISSAVVEMEPTTGRKCTKLTLGAAVTLPKGTPIKIAGAKACNHVGMPVSSDFIGFVQVAVNNSATVYIQRIEMRDIGSRNCYVEGATDLTGLNGKAVSNLLTNGKTYYPVQVRTADTLNYDGIDLDDLASAENSSEKVGEVKMHVTKFGNGSEMKNTVRWDVAALIGICDNREVGIAYVMAE